MFNDSSTDSAYLSAKIKILEETCEGLKEVDKAIYDQMLTEDRSENDIFSDLTSADEYTVKFRNIELKFVKNAEFNNVTSDIYVSRYNKVNFVDLSLLLLSLRNLLVIHANG